MGERRTKDCFFFIDLKRYQCIEIFEYLCVHGSPAKFSNFWRRSGSLFTFRRIIIKSYRLVIMSF